MVHSKNYSNSLLRMQVIEMTKIAGQQLSIHKNLVNNVMFRLRTSFFQVRTCTSYSKPRFRASNPKLKIIFSQKEAISPSVPTARPYSSMCRAHDSYSGGCGFESRRGLIFEFLGLWILKLELLISRKF